MMAEREEARLGRRMLRSVALLVLLFGPLLVVEIWARGQLDFLYPYIRTRPYWSETKLMLLERAGCPQVLGLGSSITNRVVVQPLARGQTLPIVGEPQPIESMFAFGMVGARMTLLYSAWRHIEASGCVPAYLLVEVSPGVVRMKSGRPRYYRPFLDLQTLWHLPSGFAPRAGLETADLFEFTTWHRLLVYRLRSELRRAVIEGLGFEPVSVKEATPKLDGVLSKPVNDTLLDGEYERTRTAMNERAALGTFDTILSSVHSRALQQLISEASAAGSHVILHTPPVTQIYRDINAKYGGREALCALQREFAGKAGVQWHWAYGETGYGPDVFSDWVHLNEDGASQYLSSLFAAIRADSLAPVRACRKKQPG
jgi:hypothetical protein